MTPLWELCFNLPKSTLSHFTSSFCAWVWVYKKKSRLGQADDDGEDLRKENQVFRSQAAGKCDAFCQTHQAPPKAPSSYLPTLPLLDLRALSPRGTQEDQYFNNFTHITSPPLPHQSSHQRRVVTKYKRGSSKKFSRNFLCTCLPKTIFFTNQPCANASSKLGHLVPNDPRWASELLHLI